MNQIILSYGGTVEPFSPIPTGKEMTLFQKLCSKGITDPTGIILVLEMIEGTGAVNEQTTWLKCVPDVLQDLTLTMPAEVDILEAPVLYGNLILTEHTLA